MKEPAYDASQLTLVRQVGRLALFKLKRRQKDKPDEGQINRYAGSDDDWECFDRGYFADMESTFNRMTASKFGERQGIGLDSFDKEYPHNRWLDDDFFDGPAGIQYALWVERTLDTGNGRNAFCVTISKEDDEIHWSVIHAGNVAEVREGFERARATLEAKPPAPANPYVDNPNFGRF